MTRSLGYSEDMKNETTTIDPDAQCREHGCSRWQCDESHPQALTAETITDDQIRVLRTNVLQAGDLEMVAACDTAIYGTESSPSTILSLISDGNLSEAQIAARQTCADIINSATTPLTHRPQVGACNMTSSVAAEILKTARPVTAETLATYHLDVLGCSDVSIATLIALGEAQDDMEAGRRDTEAVKACVEAFNQRIGR